MKTKYKVPFFLFRDLEGTLLEMFFGLFILLDILSCVLFCRIIARRDLVHTDTMVTNWLSIEYFHYLWLSFIIFALHPKKSFIEYFLYMYFIAKMD